MALCGLMRSGGSTEGLPGPPQRTQRNGTPNIALPRKTGSAASMGRVDLHLRHQTLTTSPWSHAGTFLEDGAPDSAHAPRNFAAMSGWPGRKEIGWWDWKSHRAKMLKCLKSSLLYQNDDFGKDFLKGFSDRLGDKAKQVMTRAVSYEVTDATVDSQIIDLASTKTNVFLNITTPKFAVQAIRKAHELGWKPMQFVDNPAASIGVVMRPAGVEAAKGIISAAFVKDPTDPQYKDDPEFQAWVAWMKKYYSAGSLEDPQNVVGYVQAQTMVQVLKQCGDTLTRENVMKQAANLKDFHPAMLLKGINMNTSATDYQPMEELLLQRFNGERFEVFGDLLSARVK
jgi:branched-chain amino acid transport system substrate-binding protein